ncbi:hypothetical protein PQE70_gp157 [Bacillus phage vB_BanS_Nate]|uniref:Uncharacterized protein n=1 Tax=Bacillus phage vB_BanS_Nate TaxID=2894788 RepID=A0AAE8YVB6_9CAUD|nr:hypothetical protein PQE70_gp157 [Bacillus phage vB_BanS_Nate]UGO51010.1 hypothetical protein NATE_157 [Bacillus phage vB_BanS_Nate]
MSMFRNNIGQRPTLKAPLVPSNMSKGGLNESPKGERPPAPPPQPKSNVGWQERMQEYMKNKRDDNLGSIITSIVKLHEENEALKQKLKDYRKEDEIAKLEAEIAQMRLDTLHTLTSKEKVKATKFKNKHYESCKGNTQYILLGTGIGTATTVQCTKCAERENITDYDGW